LLLNPVLDIGQSVLTAEAARKKSAESGEGVAGQILSFLENSMFGGAAKKAEEAGPGYAKLTPQTVGAVSEMSTYAGLPKATEVVGKLVKPVIVKGLGTYAERTYDKALGVKPEASGTDPGGHMARLVGPVWSYSQAVKKAQGLIERITPQIDKLVTDAKSKGTVVNGLDKVVDAVYDPAMAKARNLGKVETVRRLQSEKMQASGVVAKDPLTGKETLQPIDYAKGIDPITALAKKRAVMNRGWETGDPEYVRNLNRQLGHAMADALDKQVPGLGQLSKQDAALIDAREAANAARASAKVGLQDKLKGMLQAGAPGLLAYGVLRLGGAGFGSYFGAAGLMYLWNKLPSASLRAAAAARVADILSGDSMATPPPRSGVKAGPGGGATPAAPRPSPVSAAAPGASAGAGPIPAAPAPAAPSAPVAAPVPKAAPVADPITQAATDKALGRAPAQAKASATTTKVAEGVSGVPPEMKKYFDLVDSTLQKIDESKSALNKAQYQKELADLKEILNPATTEARRAALAEKIETRQRKQKSRSEAAVKAPVEASPVAKATVTETGTKSFEPLAQGASPEAALSALEGVYGELTKMPEGKTYVTALKKMAKDMKMDSTTEFSEALEVYKFMKEHGGK
jgi:hypothetical protein